MKKLATLAFLTLGACNSAQFEANVTKAEAIARDSITVICANLPAAQSGFEQLVATGKLKPTLVTRGRQAIAAMNAICVSPPTNTATAIASASSVLAAIIQATADARAQAAQ